MKVIYCSALLLTLLAAPGYAETTRNSAAEAEEPGFSITVDVDSDAAGNGALPSPDLQQMQEKAYAKLASILDATGDQMSEQDKAAVQQEIRQAMDDIASISGTANGGVHAGSRDNSTSVTDMLLGITAITLIFGSPLLIVAAVLYASYRKKRLIHDTISQYVSSGKDVPAEVMNSLHAEITPRNNLHKGLVLTGLGLGVIACFVVMDETEVAALGLIPLFIGLAQLLIWKLEAK